MTNYGIPFNNVDRTIEELEKLRLEAQARRSEWVWDCKPADTLAFIYTPKAERLAQSEYLKQTRAFNALRAELLAIEDGFAFQPGKYVDEEVPNMPAWWKRAVSPPWWLRLAIRLHIVTPRPAAQVFKDWCRDEEAWAEKFPNTPFRYNGDPYSYERRHR